MLLKFKSIRWTSCNYIVRCKGKSKKRIRKKFLKILSGQHIISIVPNLEHILPHQVNRKSEHNDFEPIGYRQGRAVEQGRAKLHKHNLAGTDNQQNRPKDTTILQIVESPFPCCKSPCIQHIPKLQEYKDAEENAHLAWINVGVDAFGEHRATISLTHEVIVQSNHQHSKDRTADEDETHHRRRDDTSL